MILISNIENNYTISYHNFILIYIIVMTVLPDHWIREKSIKEQMISPFEENVYTHSKLSYGLSSYGYDARVGTKFKIFTNISSKIIDPKSFSNDLFIEIDSEQPITIPPNSFALAHTIEKFIIPRNILVICLGKSTYARCGIIVNVTPLEPEWEGHVTLEFSNTTSSPVVIYPNEGACQFIFLKGESDCEISYLDKNGKYMYQKQEACTPIVKNNSD